MSALLFPDTTVLINFALINRMDLLERLANGHGQWCASVAQECAESARRAGLSSLEQAGAIFKEPLFPASQKERLDVILFRTELAEPNDPPRRHLGEAETLAIMAARQINGFFVTDDRSAARLAAKHDIVVVDTWPLMKVALTHHFVDCATMWGYVQTLISAGRFVPSELRNRDSFDAWVGNSG